MDEEVSRHGLAIHGVFPGFLEGFRSSCIGMWVLLFLGSPATYQVSGNPGNHQLLEWKQREAQAGNRLCIIGQVGTLASQELDDTCDHNMGHRVEQPKYGGSESNHRVADSTITPQIDNYIQCVRHLFGTLLNKDFILNSPGVCCLINQVFREALPQRASANTRFRFPKFVLSRYKIQGGPHHPRAASGEPSITTKKRPYRP